MHQLEMSTRSRVQLPVARNPQLQSVYIFNMYRAGSSLTEVLASAIEYSSRHARFNVVQALDAAGVGLVDHLDYERSAVFLEDDGNSLDKLGNFGGYLYYGFREIPQGYAERFIFIAASLVMVRDLRDVAISQYYAVNKHSTEGASGRDIIKLRETVANASLEEFILSESTISFLKRIANCYKSLITRGCRVLHYESFMTERGFDAHRLLEAIFQSLQPYLELHKPIAEVRAFTDELLGQSQHLKAHATTGKINVWRTLPKSTINRLNNQLSAELTLLGYN